MSPKTRKTTNRSADKPVHVPGKKLNFKKKTFLNRVCSPFLFFTKIECQCLVEAKPEDCMEETNCIEKQWGTKPKRKHLGRSHHSGQKQGH
ncbi:uncharacterized protein NPIL_356111 [Nephila pilipes]|uniref:Uncharacterized protein n=1 Tax=Nephila pilipes TaxID=299642 RepID=A0A8X6QLG3_NEPPI|nr:uncharacterized protein NPIL_356111 [Nephila pilipes]